MLKSALLSFATCAILAAAPAAAQTYTVGAKSTALAANLTSDPLLGVTTNISVGPLAVSQGAGPGVFSDSASVASGGGTLTLASLGIVRTQLDLNAGVLTSSVSGTSAGATANAGITNLGLELEVITRILGITNVLTLADLGAGVISSTASVDAFTGAFSGSSLLAGVTLASTLGPIDAVLLASATPAANSVLLNALGLRVTLNEQITDGDLFTTNALSVRFANFAAGTNLINGSIILGQSQVTRQVIPAAVPEPATWAMMIGGFALIGSAMRKRRPTVAYA